MAVNPTRVDEDRPVRTLLSDQNFLCIWLVGGVTGVIRWFQLLAFGVYSFEITGSPLLVSAIPILWMLPLILFGPFIALYVAWFFYLFRFYAMPYLLGYDVWGMLAFPLESDFSRQLYKLLN